MTRLRSIVATVVFPVALATPVPAARLPVGWENVKSYSQSCAAEPKAVRTTCTFQKALNAIGGGPHSGTADPHVLYVPAGEYAITHTLFLEGHRGIQIVGESSPPGVTLKWAGPSGTAVAPVVMFHSDGNPYSTFKNITWDGGKATYVVAFDHSSCGIGDGYNTRCDGLGNPWYVPDCSPDCPANTLDPLAGGHDTASAHLDSVFTNAWIGLRIGHYSYQNDEVTVRRSRFVDNTIGVSIEDSNALQEYFWDCDFTGNTIAGITNAIYDLADDGTPIYGPLNLGGGDFRVMRGWFSGNGADPGNQDDNRKGDIYITPTGNFTFRECRSTGSKRFLHVRGSGVSRTVSVIGARIEDYDAPSAILMNAPGPLFLLDNAIHSAEEDPSVVRVTGQAGAWSAILAVDNQYSAANAAAVYHSGAEIQTRSIGDSFGVHPSLIKVEMFDRPTVVDPMSGRVEFTVVSEGDDDTAVIQQAIDDATLNSPALVRIPDGRWRISETLRIGSGSDVMLVGNGPATVIQWIGDDAGPMLEIDGLLADGVIVRDLLFDAVEGSPDVRADGINIKNLDPAGGSSRILLNRVFVTEGHMPPAGDGIIAVAPGRTRLDVVDSTLQSNERGLVAFASSNPQPAEGGIAVWTSTVLGNDWDFDLHNNGDPDGGNGLRVLISSTYMEQSRHFLRATGNDGESNICVHGSKLATGGSVDPGAIFLDDLRGNFGLVNSWPFDLDDPPVLALVVQAGLAPLTIELLANTIASDPEYVLSGASDVAAIRSSQLCDPPEPGEPAPPPTFACESVSEGGGVASPIGDDPAAWTATESALVYSGVELLRDAPPGFYDEVGAVASNQINIDNVHIYSARRALTLLGSTTSAFASCPIVKSCGGGSCQKIPGSCSSTDTGQPGCLHEDELYLCGAGQTVHVETCDCTHGLCLNQSQGWFCSD